MYQRLRAVDRFRFAGGPGRSAISWLLAFVLLYGTLAPLPSLHMPQSSEGLSAELEKIRLALGEPAGTFLGRLCHNAGDPPPVAPDDEKKSPCQKSCPICELLQHSAYGLPPAETREFPFRAAAASLPFLKPVDGPRPRAAGTARPRAPPSLV
jgi:hypothetical protein